MYDLTDSQMTNCAAKNVTQADGMLEVLESTYDLSPEITEIKDELDKLLNKFRKVSLKHQLDAEITLLTARRDSL